MTHDQLRPDLEAGGALHIDLGQIIPPGEGGFSKTTGAMNVQRVQRTMESLVDEDASPDDPRCLSGIRVQTRSEPERYGGSEAYG